MPVALAVVGWLMGAECVYGETPFVWNVYVEVHVLVSFGLVTESRISFLSFFFLAQAALQFKSKRRLNV